MKLIYTIKFQLNRQFEMHAMTFELSEESLSDEIRQLPFGERMANMQRVLLLSGVMVQVAKGYINKKEAQKEQLAIVEYYRDLLKDAKREDTKVSSGGG